MAIEKTPVLIVGAGPTALAMANYFKAKMRQQVEVHILSKIPGNRPFYQVYGIQQEAVFLIRPDGHIGFKSANVDITEVKNYLKCILRSFQEPT